MKRAALLILGVLVFGTVPSGATFTAGRGSVETISAAADFGVHVTVTGPSSPKSGTVTLTASATETVGGSITQLVFEVSPAGANTWTTACTDNVAPIASCGWTTSGNGTYDVRARATSTSGYSRVSATWPNLVIDNTAPTVTIHDPGGSWFRGTLQMRTASAGDTGGAGLSGVAYSYKLSSAGTWTAACSSSTGPNYTCNFDTVAAGLTNGSSYDFRATATDAAGNTAHSTYVNRQVDNAAPSGTLTDPGSPLAGTKTVGATSPADAHSGVASIVVQYSPAGANSWSPACTATSTPWTCPWNTTAVTSQLYDMRVVVTDVAGNTHTAPLVANRRVDNLPPMVSLASPPATITGNVTLSATASDAESGMANVALQYRVATTGTWTNACATIAAPGPYQCTASSTGVADGLYDFRAAATDVAGNASYSVVTDRRIENANPYALDVQTADGGGTPGVIQAQDTMTLTYSETMDPASIIAGWNGVGERDIYVRMSHHNQGDRLLFYNSTNTALIPLAASPGVVLEADYLSNSATWTAKLTTTGAAFVVRLVSMTAGSVNGSAPAGAIMNWSPSTAAKDLAGKANTNVVRNESGSPADAEF